MGRSPIRKLIDYDGSGPASFFGPVLNVPRVHDETGHIQIEIGNPSLITGPPNPSLFIVLGYEDTTPGATTMLLLSRNLVVQPTSEIILNVRFAAYILAFMLDTATALTPITVWMQE